MILTCASLWIKLLHDFLPPIIHIASFMQLHPFIYLHFARYTLLDDDAKNECHPDFAGKTYSVDICAPTDVKGEAVRVATETDEIVEYLSISWKPCSVGILDLRGFQVVFQCEIVPLKGSFVMLI